MAFALRTGFSIVLGIGIQLHHHLIVVDGCRAEHDFIYSPL